MELMELRETIDGTTDDTEIRRLMGENKQRIEKTVLQLADAFEQDDLDQALELTAVLQYWNRADEKLREKVLTSD